LEQPAYFVVDVDIVCLFKARLDKFWMHQDVLYDFAADLTGIGDRSVRESSRLYTVFHKKTWQSTYVNNFIKT